jgi:hypothetical protein
MINKKLKNVDNFRTKKIIQIIFDRYIFLLNLLIYGHYLCLLENMLKFLFQWTVDAN